MVTFVFDSSAAMRYLDDRAGAARVEQIIEGHALGETKLVISAVQWGEIAKIIGKRHGPNAVPTVLAKLLVLGFRVTPVSADQAVRAAMLQNTLKLSYADAFVVVLAQDEPSSILVTADFDFMLANHLVTIEFLPPNTP